MPLKSLLFVLLALILAFTGCDDSSISAGNEPFAEQYKGIWRQGTGKLTALNPDTRSDEFHQRGALWLLDGGVGKYEYFSPASAGGQYLVRRFEWRAGDDNLLILQEDIGEASATRERFRIDVDFDAVEGRLRVYNPAQLETLMPVTQPLVEYADFYGMDFVTEVDTNLIDRQWYFDRHPIYTSYSPTLVFSAPDLHTISTYVSPEEIRLTTEGYRVHGDLIFFFRAIYPNIATPFHYVIEDNYLRLFPIPQIGDTLVPDIYRGYTSHGLPEHQPFDSRIEGSWHLLSRTVNGSEAPIEEKELEFWVGTGENQGRFITDGVVEPFTWRFGYDQTNVYVQWQTENPFGRMYYVFTYLDGNLGLGRDSRNSENKRVYIEELYEPIEE